MQNAKCKNGRIKFIFHFALCVLRFAFAKAFSYKILQRFFIKFCNYFFPFA